MDFLELYRQLNLRPGCGLLEFKRAYRRHVALVHPDRLSGQFDADAAERFQRLTAQYGAAMEFFRRHGRLPGAAGAPRFAAVPASRPRMIDTAAPRSSRPAMMILLAVVAVCVLLWNVDYLSSSPEASPAHAAAGDDPSDPDPVQAPVLALGMSPEDVRAIEGEPLIVHNDRWEYGPSWIRFERDQVVEWHSSPLHALKTVDGRSHR
jgi:hypothetical protein